MVSGTTTCSFGCTTQHPIITMRKEPQTSHIVRNMNKNSDSLPRALPFSSSFISYHFSFPQLPTSEPTPGWLTTTSSMARAFHWVAHTMACIGLLHPVLTFVLASLLFPSSCPQVQSHVLLWSCLQVTPTLVCTLLKYPQHLFGASMGTLLLNAVYPPLWDPPLLLTTKRLPLLTEEIKLEYATTSADCHTPSHGAIDQHATRLPSTLTQQPWASPRSTHSRHHVLITPDGHKTIHLTHIHDDDVQCSDVEKLDVMQCHSAHIDENNNNDTNNNTKHTTTNTIPLHKSPYRLLSPQHFANTSLYSVVPESYEVHVEDMSAHAFAYQVLFFFTAGVAHIGLLVWGTLIIKRTADTTACAGGGAFSGVLLAVLVMNYLYPAIWAVYVFLWFKYGWDHLSATDTLCI